ncbi:hypothetical protein KC354_g4662 [Hortaea werneckii]|nr:hypothetical protein KC354_g4662 [Hortaea werneckii]
MVGTTSAEREKAAAARANQNPSPVTSLLDRLAEWKVPHSWFTSFYAVSIFWSLFWAVQFASLLASHTFSLDDFAVPPPSFRTFLSLLLFILASGFQHDCHAYLCSLKSPSSTTTTTTAAANKDNDSSSSSSGKPKDSYKLPTHPAFTHLIVPHYTAECLLYLSLAFLAAPSPHPQSPTTAGARAQAAAGRGSVFNYTLLAACIFVVVNLGVTAQGTREWYLVRFGGSREGRELVERRWRLVPGVW